MAVSLHHFKALSLPTISQQMKRTLSSCLLGLHLIALYAQSDTIAQPKAIGQEEIIHLSNKFLKELDKTFSFDPLDAPIQLPKETDTDLLHQWVGRPDTTLLNNRKDTTKYTREYVAFKIYLHDLQPITSTSPMDFNLQSMELRNHHGENGYYYKDTHTTLNGVSVGGFDFNKLAQYIRPKEILLRKSRAIADKNRQRMDRIYPLVGETLYTKAYPQKPDTSHVTTLGDSLRINQ